MAINVFTIRKFLLKRDTVTVVYIISGIITAVQLILAGSHAFQIPSGHKYKPDVMSDPAMLQHFVGQRYTAYNNYVVFKESFRHLINGQNLYAIYPREQWDLFKYSPSFALLMAPFAYLPDMAGLILWNLLNALALLTALRMLPLKEEQKSMMLLFLIPELLTNLQNAQSNALLAGLIIAAYGCMERKKMALAALWLVIASYIKIYGAVGFCLFFFYPDKLKFVLYAALWTILLFFLPVISTRFHTLVWQYQNWQALIAADQTASYGLSIMGWLHSWFGLNEGKNYIMLAGIILFFVPFVRTRLYKDERYRLMTLAAMLIWVVIFNYKAESPTFIIAVSGATIWFFSGKGKPWRIILICAVFAFTSLVESDLFSNHTKEYILEPYTIKVIPCIIVWGAAMAEMLSKKRGKDDFNHTAIIK